MAFLAPGPVTNHWTDDSLIGGRMSLDVNSDSQYVLSRQQQQASQTWLYHMWINWCYNYIGPIHMYVNGAIFIHVNLTEAK